MSEAFLFREGSHLALRSFKLPFPPVFFYDTLYQLITLLANMLNDTWPTAVDWLFNWYSADMWTDIWLICRQSIGWYCRPALGYGCPENANYERSHPGGQYAEFQLYLTCRIHFQHSGAKIRVFEENTDIIKFWLFCSVGSTWIIFYFYSFIRSCQLIALNHWLFHYLFYKFKLCY